MDFWNETGLPRQIRNRSQGLKGYSNEKWKFTHDLVTPNSIKDEE